MLQKLRDDITQELSRIGETKEKLLMALGEDLSTTKKAGEWRPAFAGELAAIKERKDKIKEKNRVVARWAEMVISCSMSARCQTVESSHVR